jgi:hypothetical protein
MSGSGSARPGAVAWPRSNLNDSAADGLFRTHSLLELARVGVKWRRKRHRFLSGLPVRPWFVDADDNVWIAADDELWRVRLR